VVNVARSREEAEKQALGESAAAAAQAQSLEAKLAAEMAATEDAG
jgi:hypothetical protein